MKSCSKYQRHSPTGDLADIYKYLQLSWFRTLAGLTDSVKLSHMIVHMVSFESIMQGLYGTFLLGSTARVRSLYQTPVSLRGRILADLLNPPLFISADTKQRTRSGLSQAVEIVLSCAYSLLRITHPFTHLSVSALGDNPTRLMAISLLVYALVCQRDYRAGFPMVESLAQ